MIQQLSVVNTLEETKINYLLEKMHHPAGKSTLPSQQPKGFHFVCGLTPKHCYNSGKQRVFGKDKSFAYDV